MQVHITETTTIHPSQPPFDHDHTLPLSHLDTDRNLHVTFRYLRVYVNTTHHHGGDPFHVITTALSATLVHYYPLTGILRRSIDGRLELHCAVGRGVPLIRATVDCSLSSLNHLDDPDEKSIEQLVPDWDPEDALSNPFTLQITEFGCGGYVVGAALHHSMNDGLGGSQIFNAMAELARGPNSLSVQPVWDRSSLLAPRDPVQLEFPIHEFLALDRGFSPYLQSNGPIVKECFPMKEEWLDRFKGLLGEQSGLKFTTFEALGAFIWRARYVIAW